MPSLLRPLLRRRAGEARGIGHTLARRALEGKAPAMKRSEHRAKSLQVTREEIRRYTGAADLEAWENAHPEAASALWKVIEVLRADTDEEAVILGAELRLEDHPPALGIFHDRLQVRLVLLQAQWLGSGESGC